MSPVFSFVVSVYTSKLKMMKWEDITDEARKAAEQVLTHLLTENRNVSGDQLSSRLQDLAYLEKRSKQRERYCGQEAFRRMKRQELKRLKIRLWSRIASVACILIAGILLIVPKQKTEISPLGGHAMPEIRSAEMKALLIKTDGEQVMLGKESRQLKEKNGMLIAVDSGGLEYPAGRQSAFHSADYNELIVPRAGMYCLSLSDGTRVWLNADSRLKYPVFFAENERRIRLSGEGYFQVAKDTNSPFIVETDLGEIRVLGTEFNIKCYPDETIVATTLVNGKVSFTNPGVPEKILDPGQQLLFEKGNREAKIRRVNVCNYTGWKDNQLIFHKETLEEIMRILARWYDIEVVFENDALKQLEFSGNLDKYTDIETFFRLFGIGADVRFQLSGRTVYIKSAE